MQGALQQQQQQHMPLKNSKRCSRFSKLLLLLSSFVSRPSLVVL
jgi:hypothetical protein